VTWQKNFLIPRGNTSKIFTMECARIINLYNNNTIMKPIALKSLMVFIPAMLQKPIMKSKAKDHSRYLQKRLQLWKIGDLYSLMSECIEIQRKLVAAKEKSGFNLTQSFTRLMLTGNLSQASNSQSLSTEQVEVF